jgi:hypothetical protein
MKKKIGQTQKENTQFNNNKHRPEIRDNLDSRMHQEQQIKGDDVTHNKKEPDNRKKRKEGRE